MCSRPARRDQRARRGRGRLPDRRHQGRRRGPGRRYRDPRGPAVRFAVAGIQAVKPMVFAGLYPIDSSDYEELRDAIEKLRLNDSAFSYEPETSVALGFGFRCGFLGLLHIEITQERLEREFSLDLITTAPTVAYRVHLTDGSSIEIDSPAKLPDSIQVDSDLRALYRGDDPHAERIPRRHLRSLRGKAGHAERSFLRRAPAGRSSSTSCR